MTTQAGLEYLGSDAPPRRRPWLVPVVLVLLACVTLAGILWAQRAQGDARRALLAGYESSVAEARAAEGRVQVALAYVSQALWRPDLPAATEDSLWQVVGEQAAVSAEALSDLGARIDAITVLPWSGEEREARDALVALVAAQESRFRAMADDARSVPSYLASGPVPTEDAARALRSIDASNR